MKRFFNKYINLPYSTSVDDTNNNKHSFITKNNNNISVFVRVT